MDEIEKISIENGGKALRKIGYFYAKDEENA